MVDRRNFIKVLTGLTAGAVLQNSSFAAKIAEQSDRLGKIMPQRPLGNTGESVTILCVGGYHFGEAKEPEAQKIIETALENGIRFFDCAVQYQNGGSEEYYGKFLTPKYRDVSFLMTKSQAKTAEGVRKELEDSLRRMNTDSIDLWQIHALTSREDVEERLNNGVLDEFLKAKEEGKVRYIGFTGHSTPEAHLRMLELTRDTQPFACAQMPINVADPSYSSFIENVVPKLIESNIGVLAMKTLAFGNFFNERRDKDNPLVIPDRITLQDALHFVWSLPISSIVTGARSSDELQEKIDLAMSFSSMAEEKRKELIAKVAEVAGKDLESYKS